MLQGGLQAQIREYSNTDNNGFILSCNPPFQSFRVASRLPSTIMTHMELVLKFQARRQIVKAIYIRIRIIHLQVQIRE